MKVRKRKYEIKGLEISIRGAETKDAKQLSKLRLQIDGETEFLDREPGEAYLDVDAFEQLIKEDQFKDTHLFLVAEVNSKIVGFSRCEGNSLNRMAHKVTFGICIAKEYWGLGIGKHLIETSLLWAKDHSIKKIELTVLETNVNAINLYTKYGFEVEGELKEDKRLKDGKYYSTIIMGKILF